MPLPFLGRSGKRGPAPPPPLRVALAPDQLESEEQSLRLQYHARSSHGVRLPATHDIPVRLPSFLEGFGMSPVELIEPLPLEFQDATPTILRPESAMNWLTVHHRRSPIARHALVVFESLNAIDLAYETFAVAMLFGDVDGEGVPRYDAIVGGPVSYWDETTGDLIVRLVLGWGGEGIRGDTDRIAQRLLTRLMVNLMASQGATELGRVERPVAVTDGRHSACPHCGFPAVDRRAAYCPKCGMRTRA